MADKQSAAFGVFPQMKPRRSVQDREAAKDMDVAMLRGFVSGVAGMPGDLESLARLLLNIQGPENFSMPRTKDEALEKLGQIFGANRVDYESVLPTSEDIEKRLPFKSVSETPVGRAVTGASQLAGGFYTGPGSAYRLVTGIPKAVVKAGKDFAMAAGQPATRVAPVTPGVLTRVQEAVRQSKGDYGAKRVQRAADEVKDLEKLYQEEALRQAFLGDNAKAVMTMRPGDFEKFAQRLNPSAKDLEMANTIPVDYVKGLPDMTQDQYIDYLMRIEGGFADVPRLEIDKFHAGARELPFISGHEGRHRSRAMERAGQPQSLVRLLPRAELREPFPRMTQEEYIEALRRELELSDRMVTPEREFTNIGGPVYRPIIELPEPYAEGGPAKGPLSGVRNN